MISTQVFSDKPFRISQCLFVWLYGQRAFFKPNRVITVRSIIMGTLDKDEQNILYKINYTNTELYCMLNKMGKSYYAILVQLLREIYIFLFSKRQGSKLLAPLFSIVYRPPLVRIDTEPFAKMHYEIGEHVGRDLRPFLVLLWSALFNLNHWCPSPENEMAIGKC